MNISIKTKIVGLAVISSILISAVSLTVFFIFSGRMSNSVSKDMLNISKTNLSNLVRNIYSSCQVADEVLNDLLFKKLNEAEDLINQKGKINISEEKAEWQITNQFTNQHSKIMLPKLNLGNKWLGQSRSFDSYQPIVDDLVENHFTVTIFQRINEQGDMLRVATNVKLENGERAIGTYIPAINSDGSKSNIISQVLNSKPYFGNAFVVNAYYQSLYKPLKDKFGKVIGMIYTGVSLDAAGKLRESILKTVVGKTGYVYVLGGSGPRKGYYIISKGGKRDNENIWDTKDAAGELVIQKIINQAINQTDGSVSFIEYPWKNADDNEAKNKIVALSYFKPFDWVIGAGTNFEEIEEASIIIEDGFSEIYIVVSIAVLIALILVIITSLVISRKISYPIAKSAMIMKDISEGNLYRAKNDINALEKWYQGK